VQISILFRRTRVRRNNIEICNNEEDEEFLRHHLLFTILLTVITANLLFK